ncbi:hypothetical protein Ddye_011252 [Dipteronia dyeriana]|uniref:BRCT domain-containing protein n=1 Tax=Dipteronia dyeriana TaxID=168575 RepID=A0AAD9UBW8_9ROSI|nr:hypothetical protein Ddye_011252 [Dipteronia dyeriana]
MFYVVNCELFVMSDSETRSGNGANQTNKRNLPSWMSSTENRSKSHGKKTTDGDKNEEPKQAERHVKERTGSCSKEAEQNKISAASGSSATKFSKYLEGVVFVLSGFVNPERSTLRSQAIEMGAEYRADWNSECTLLVCAFANTPKFRQVEADCGTIVSKEWISECYNQKKLIDIESYLMHVGKPWRRSNIPGKTSGEGSPPSKSQKVERGSESKPTASTSSLQHRASNPAKENFSPSELKKWVADDLNKTISWLEGQEEKPEQSEIKQIAAEGILTCLQDVIDILEQNQDIRQITEQWQCLPHVVVELAKHVGTEKGSASLSKEDLCKQARACKRVYEDELRRLESGTLKTRKKLKTDESGRGNNGRKKATSSDVAGYDSEETIEMTEEEIDRAYETVIS